MINYISCGVLWLGLALKLRDLIGHRSDPFLRAITALLALASLCWLLGSPPTVSAVNRTTGIANLAAPLTYAVITAYGAACLVLVVYWRDGRGGRARARRWIISYAVVIAAIGVLFALGDARTERRIDFDTYYATTPYISEMIVLYLVAHLTAVTVTGLWSVRWAMGSTVRGWVRASLLTLGLGTALSAGYSLSRLVAAVARWCGKDWTVLATKLSPGFAGAGAFLTVTGVLLPFIGHHVTRWRHELRAYTRLAPLERQLEELLKRRTLRLRRPLSPLVWLPWRQSSIHNGLNALQAYLDQDLYERTYERELRRADDVEQAEATALATTIAAAAVSERAGRPAARSAGHSPLQPQHLELAVLVRIAGSLNAPGRVVPAPAHTDAAAGSTA
ncbi:MAB_1171c family putative transporter [Streptomyces collinus]|uniref:MAB_1171c family putative transporter n=1 Tax=Streptomyces collinus TaxID=42684 RepID=UPI0033F34060